MEASIFGKREICCIAIYSISPDRPTEWMHLEHRAANGWGRLYNVLNLMRMPNRKRICAERELPILSMHSETIPFRAWPLKLFFFFLLFFIFIWFLLRRLPRAHGHTLTYHKWSCSFHISRDELISRIPLMLWYTHMCVCAIRIERNEMKPL